MFCVKKLIVLFPTDYAYGLLYQHIFNSRFATLHNLSTTQYLTTKNVIC